MSAPVSGTNVQLANLIAGKIRENTQTNANYILKTLQEIDYGYRP